MIIWIVIVLFVFNTESKCPRGWGVVNVQINNMFRDEKAQEKQNSALSSLTCSSNLIDFVPDFEQTLNFENWTINKHFKSI